ncbi:hypothetical protein [Crateriforma spongiae]|uniref:hypothetical protein n=1 Tax=Crateriforma spongiae TaxID=2724528 RepID=UPI0014484BA6|nr:hypothetical protein [Crateriforma spongiae]
MADTPDATDAAAPKSGFPWPVVFVGIAGLSALMGFAGIASIWLGSGPPDDGRRLQLAMDQYLQGQPIIAGKIAEQVELGELESELPPEGDPGERIVEEPAEPPDDPTENGDAAEPAVAPETKDDAGSLRALRAFLVGAGKMALSESATGTAARREIHSDAVPYLKEASEKGFPDGREAEGNRLLGLALLSTGEYAAAADALDKAIERDQTMRRDLLPLLASAQLRLKIGGAQKSLDTIKTFLSLPTLSEEQQRQGQLIRTRALLAMARWQDAKAIIDGEFAKFNASDLATQTRLASFRDEFRLLNAQRQIDQTVEDFDLNESMASSAGGATGSSAWTSGRDEDPRIKQAIASRFEPVLVEMNRLQREAEPRIGSQARLLAARAYQLQGDLELAIAQLTSVRQQRPFGAAALVGGIREIELLADQGRGEEVVQTTRYMMHELGSTDRFDSSLITKDEFRKRLSAAIEVLRRKNEFESAIETARSLSPLYSSSESLEEEGQGYLQWAQATLADAAGGEIDRSTFQVARHRYHSAGDAFHQAAKLRFNEPEYLDLLWSAIQAYQQGRHFSRSINMLQDYLRYEQRRRQPRGLIALGRALLAEDRAEEAIDAFETCIVEFERDPLRYDARLMAALASIELANREQRRRRLQDEDAEAVTDIDAIDYVQLAKDFLHANLQDGDLRPDSPAWRDSMYSLGELLYEQITVADLESSDQSDAEKIELYRQNDELLQETIRVLDEAVQRYWPERRAETTAYLLARTHALAARWAATEADDPSLLDAARRTSRQRSEAELLAALEGFTQLRQLYERREEEQPLSARADVILRNCLMSEADTLLEMGRLDEASTAYRAISLRYMNQPPALEAILGQAQCVRKMGRTREADLLIKQALSVLSKIPPELDSEFDRTTRFDRGGWQRYLQWMDSMAGGTRLGEYRLGVTG